MMFDKKLHGVYIAGIAEDVSLQTGEIRRAYSIEKGVLLEGLFFPNTKV